MCQGIYVFAIFVCKRNVLKLIKGRNTPQAKVVDRLKHLSTRSRSNAPRDLQPNTSTKATEEIALSSFKE